MRESSAEFNFNFTPCNLDMARLWLIESRDIWLALEENHEDSRRLSLTEPIQLEMLTATELTLYHHQLFYWLLGRERSCVFSNLLPKLPKPLQVLSVRN